MNGRINRTGAIAIGAAAIFVVVAVLFGFTVVSEEEEAAFDVEFDAAAYVDGVWDNVRTTIKEQPVDLAAVLAQLEPDADGNTPKEALLPVVDEYGRVTPGDAHVYAVTTTGTVTDVETEGLTRTLGLAVDGYNGPVVVRVYIGQRIPSAETAVRDATGLINFGDFKEQTEYGKVATEINKRVVDGLTDTDFEALEGQQVQVTGATMMRTQNLVQIPVGELMIVPVEITTP
jgi:predicted lipoprotein